MHTFSNGVVILPLTDSISIHSFISLRPQWASVPAQQRADRSALEQRVARGPNGCSPADCLSISNVCRNRPARNSCDRTIMCCNPSACAYSQPHPRFSMIVHCHSQLDFFYSEHAGAATRILSDPPPPFPPPLSFPFAAQSKPRVTEQCGGADGGVVGDGAERQRSAAMHRVPAV